MSTTFDPDAIEKYGWRQDTVLGPALPRAARGQALAEPPKTRAEAAEERRLLLDDETAFLEACAAIDVLKEKA